MVLKHFYFSSKKEFVDLWCFRKSPFPRSVYRQNLFDSPSGQNFSIAMEHLRASLACQRCWDTRYKVIVILLALWKGVFMAVWQKGDLPVPSPDAFSFLKPWGLLFCRAFLPLLCTWRASPRDSAAVMTQARDVGLYTSHHLKLRKSFGKVFET